MMTLTNAEAEALLADIDATRGACCTGTHTQCVVRAAMRHGVSGAQGVAWATARGLARWRTYHEDEFTRPHHARYDSAARTALVRVLSTREHAYRAAQN